MHQRRDQLLRIDRAYRLRVCCSPPFLQQMDETHFRLDALEIQRDAHAERGRGAEIAVEREVSCGTDILVDRAEDAMRRRSSCISIRTRSPNFRNGVFGAPLSIVSSMRRSAMQAEPDVAGPVRHGARADDGAGRQRTGLGGMGDQLREIERHVDAGVGRAELLAVQVGPAAADAACRRASACPVRRASPPRAKTRSRAWTGRSRSSWRARSGSDCAATRRSPASPA